MELAKILINNGKIAVEFSNAQDVVGVLVPVLTQFLSLPEAVGQQPISTADVRARKRGRVSNVTSLRPISSPTLPGEINTKKRRRPTLHLSPKQFREMETLFLDICEEINTFWRLDRDSRKPESRSNVIKQLIDEFEEKTGYRASGRTTLGRVCSRNTKLNTLIRDGKGPEFRDFVRAKNRIYNSEMIRI